jgi:hypothetical protein
MASDGEESHESTDSDSDPGTGPQNGKDADQTADQDSAMAQSLFPRNDAGPMLIGNGQK